MAKYNGHSSWNAWNVCLWLHNDEGLYRSMLDYITQYGSKERAARAMARDYRGERTPDGGRYNVTTIRLAMREA